MSIAQVVPFFFVLVGTGIALWLIDRFLLSRRRVTKFARQGTLVVLTVVGLIAAILILPDQLADKSNLVQVLGIAVTAALTLASTTLVANAMAGFMLRAVRSFRPGDFVRVEDHIGRISELGLFHVEIQTAQRDLTTLPNQFLITRPVTVVRSDGTIISADVSLGYDVAHDTVEPLLVEAARAAGLGEPFVQVTELGDATVMYRVSGLLARVEDLFGVQSRLKRRVLDSLHDGGVEIASPAFIAHRDLEKRTMVPPKKSGRGAKIDSQKETEAPKELIFDKAEEAQEADRVRATIEELEERLKEQRQQLKKAEDHEKEGIQAEIEVTEHQIAELEKDLTEDEPEKPEST